MMYTEQRRDAIINCLAKNGQVAVADLSEKFQVTPATIRSDLAYLEKHNKLTRTHGGAIPKKKIGEYQTIFEKRVVNTDKKAQIAKKAVDLIEEGDTIALDSGTTTFELAKELNKFNKLNIVLNDFATAQYLSENTDHKLIFIGGLIGRDINSTNGPLAIKILRDINCDKAFMACESFDYSKGFSTFDENQAAYKKMLMDTANTKIMLIDTSKFKKISSFTFSKLEDYDYIVTDKVSKEDREKIEKVTKLI